MGLKTISRNLSRDIYDLIVRVSEGRMSVREATDAFEKLYAEAATDAFLAGRTSRKITGEGVGDDVVRVISSRVAHQAEYFRNFARDAAAGVGRMSYSRRAELYGRSLWGMFQMGRATDPTARYLWVLNPVADHCADCVARAERSEREGGFTAEQLTIMGWPGEGTTICRTNCRCTVVPVRDGAPAFGLPEADSVQDWEAWAAAHPRIPASGLHSVIVTPEFVRSAARSAQGDPAVVERVVRGVIAPKKATIDGDVAVWHSRRGDSALAVRADDDSDYWLVLALIAEEERKRLDESDKS